MNPNSTYTYGISQCWAKTYTISKGLPPVIKSGFVFLPAPVTCAYAGYSKPWQYWMRLEYGGVELFAWCYSSGLKEVKNEVVD